MQIELPSYLQPSKAAQPDADQHVADTDMLASSDPAGNLTTDLNRHAAGTTASDAAGAQQMIQYQQPSSATTSVPASPPVNSKELLQCDNDVLGQPPDSAHPGSTSVDSDQQMTAGCVPFAQDDMQVLHGRLCDFICLHSL